MSTLVEEKKPQCTKCQMPLGMLDVFAFPVEMTCGCEVCMRCIIKELPNEEDAELCC